MEKLLLGTFFSNDELDIVNEEDVVGPVFFTERNSVVETLFLLRMDQLICEFLRGHIEDLGAGIIFQDKMGH